MNPVAVDQCPVKERPGTPRLTGVEDHFFGTRGSWSYWREPETGHLWLNPRPADADIPALYTEYYTHGAAATDARSTWEQAMAWARYRRLGYSRPAGTATRAKLLSYVPTVADAAEMSVLRLPASKSGRLLDFGCGDGRFMAQMARLGWTVAGVEPDSQAVRALKEQFGFDARSSLDDSPDWHGQFDVVTLNHVIEHVPDPLCTLRQCAALLAPAGTLIITTPNADSLGARLFGRFWRGLEPPRHLNVFTGASLRAVAADADLRVSGLTTATRLARGLFYSSVWASRGRHRIELEPPGGAPIKVAGYAFQLLEGALCVINPSLGEELLCVARADD